MDSSSEDFEDLNCIEVGDLDTLDISDGPTKKPHFLDYDAAPPTGEELQYSCYSSLPDSSSRQSLNAATTTNNNNNNANDLDKNNANEKSTTDIINYVPSDQGDRPEDSQHRTQRILLTRRRSAAEVQSPVTPGTGGDRLPNTGVRKKDFPTSTGYHSLDYASALQSSPR